MSAPYPYRVKGTGRYREILDGGRVVGCIQGSGETWIGYRTDGTLVRDEAGHAVRSPHHRPLAHPEPVEDSVIPFEVGSRVVCPDPTGRRFVGVVTHVHTCGDLSVSHGAWCYRASVEEVRPVMPRDRHDVDRDRWWWRNDRPVWVTWTATGVVWSTSPGWPYGLTVSSADKWAGPVQPPPEVRS